MICIWTNKLLSEERKDPRILFEAGTYNKSKTESICVVFKVSLTLSRPVSVLCTCVRAHLCMCQQYGQVFWFMTVLSARIAEPLLLMEQQLQSQHIHWLQNLTGGQLSSAARTLLLLSCCVCARILLLVAQMFSQRGGSMFGEFIEKLNKDVACLLVFWRGGKTE